MVKPKIIATQRRSELQQFAQWFHQDFFLMAPDLLTGTRMYLETLTADRKILLADELGTFLVEHRSPEVIRNGWRRLGAGVAPRGLDVPATFRAMLDLIRQS